ncbi:hypothetical protein F4808DRAFT_467103 [Astrocystis sublimbata]|nr:hypothetical protein F4808DRAFT_467103 [Astrocystis sublimbata]
MAYCQEIRRSQERDQKNRRPPRTGTSTSSSASYTIRDPAQASDPDFDTSVLTPHGITIDANSTMLDFHDHLSFPSLPENRIERYNAYKKMLALNIWQSPDDERARRIQEGFYSRTESKCNEAEYYTYTLNEMFLNERGYTIVQEPPERSMAPVRTLKLSQEPSPETWKVPPQLSSSRKQYDWDIRPDCAYYISILAFPIEFRSYINNYVSVVRNRACCPYLTIEFKKYAEDPQTDINRLAAASAIALYNRWHLKHRALKVLDITGDWSEEHKSHLRHYGITFAGRSWELWCTIPKTYEVWSGCTMSNMYSGDFGYSSSIVLLSSIVNDIHYWGLAVHGKSCLVDIGLLAQGVGRRISWISERIEDFEIGAT